MLEGTGQSARAEGIPSCQSQLEVIPQLRHDPVHERLGVRVEVVADVLVVSLHVAQHQEGRDPHRRAPVVDSGHARHVDGRVRVVAGGAHDAEQLHERDQPGLQGLLGLGNARRPSVVAPAAQRSRGSWVGAAIRDCVGFEWGLRTMGLRWP